MKGKQKNSSYKGSAACPESVPSSHAFAKKPGRIEGVRKAVKGGSSYAKGPKLNPKREY